MENQNLANVVSGFTAEVEAWLTAFTESAESSGAFRSEVLAEVCAYALHSGGKRVRPVLSLLVADMIGVPPAKLRTLVLATEMVHTSSLIHDDLPGLDDDTLRRGKPTCHVAFGEGNAIIAGDALIARAFRTIAADDEIELAVRVRWIELLAEATEALCDGQALDLDSNYNSLSGIAERIRQIEECHRRKTGALFRFAVGGPAELLEGPTRSSTIAICRELGLEVGLLFQMTDDLLDAADDDGDAGFIEQPHPSDEGRGDGMSLVALIGKAKTKGLILKKEGKISELLAKFGERSLAIQAFVTSLAGRRG